MYMYLPVTQNVHDWRRLYYLHSVLDLRHLRNLLDLRDLPCTTDMVSDIAEIPDLRAFQEMQAWLDSQSFHDPQHLRIMRDLRRMLDLREELDNSSALGIVSTLFDLLKQPADAGSSTVLLTLYTILCSISTEKRTIVFEKVRESIETFLMSPSLTKEQRLLTKAIQKLVAGANDSSAKPAPTAKDEKDNSSTSHAPPQSPPTNLSPDDLAVAVDALKQQQKLTKPDVRNLLDACTSTAELSDATSKKIGADTAQKVAWALITRQSTSNKKGPIHQFELNEQALNFEIKALDDPDIMRCAAAAQLLQHCARPPDEISSIAAEKIREKLRREVFSFRPLDVPDTSRIWQADDVLFKTLEILVG